MFNFKPRRGAALGLALVLTVSVLAGLDQLATRQHAATIMACACDAVTPWLARASTPPAC